MDGDGVGEFGTFGEMTGADGVRADEDGTKRGPKVDPPILSPALANASAVGVVTKAGYCFRIFLPCQGGGAVHEGKSSSWSYGGGSGRG